MNFCKFSFSVLFMLGVFLLVLELARREFDPGGGGQDWDGEVANFLFNNPTFVKFDYLQNKLSSSKEACLFHTCFDINRCSLHHRNIKVHIYPPAKYYSGDTILEASAEYLQILQAIYTSEFYTADPEEACIFIPSLDTLNYPNHREEIESILASSLEHWNQGINHLIFTFAGDPGSMKIGKAMLASPNFDTHNYRPMFDVGVPMYIPREVTRHDPPAAAQQDEVHHPPPHLSQSSHQQLDRRKQSDKRISILVLANYVESEILHKIRESGRPGVHVVHPCRDNNNLYCHQGDRLKVEDLVARSRYCFASGRRPGLLNMQLHLYLSQQCVPVILRQEALRFPFSEILDWSQLAIQVRSHDLARLDQVVMDGQHSYIQKANQILQAFNRYMRSPADIALTTLGILDSRVFPEKCQSSQSWNMQTNNLSPLFLDRYPRPASPGFTAVILTYNRVDSLFQILRNLEGVTSLTRILIIWNHQTVPPPSTNEWPKINKPMKVLQTPHNRLSNRFYPYTEIETECVFSLDDDINMLSTDEIEFGFQIWREFPDRIVGFPSRLHYWNQTSFSWAYDSEWKNQISLILTGAAFYNNYWSYVYTGSPEPKLKEIRSWVDENMNCEDIAFNFMVANITDKPNIKIGPRKKFRCLTSECDNTGMLSQDSAHLARRSQCLDKFSRAYARMPLKSIEFRADPLLYKEQVPPGLQVYSDIGTM